MLVPALLTLSLAGWVPARWSATDPATLDLVAGTPVNCLLMEEPSAEFAAAAASRGIAVLAVVRPGGDTLAAARAAVEAKLAGLVLEGEFDRAMIARTREVLAASKLALVELPPRHLLRLDAPLVGTSHAVWPGVQAQPAGAAQAAPTGGPWIDTNTGFLRYLRAATEAPIWVANTPPPKTVLPVSRYLQAIGDAAITGARWVVALDREFNGRLLAGDPAALRDWRRIAAHLKFYEEHKEWRAWPFHGQLALIQDIDSGALLNGGVLDMIAVKHTPVRPVPKAKLNDEALRAARLAVTVDPASLTDAQKEALSGVARRGGTLLSGPPGWKFPAPRADQIALDKPEVEKLNDIWRDMNSVMGRRNLGARLFNVSSMLSNLLASPDGKQVVLHLVNYSNYPVENITVHLVGGFARARLLTPEDTPRDLEVYPVAEGTGVDIPQAPVCAALVLDWK